MNGGRPTRVTSTPLRHPASHASAMPMSSASSPGTPFVGGERRHDHHRQDGDRADRQVDAGGEDDEGLADAERADDGDLLDQQRERVRLRRTAG